MASISRSAVVPYTPAEMYALVNDIDAYSEFLPWCRSSQVISRDEDEVRAKIELARGAVRKSFTTCNRLQRNKMIEMRLVEGPFNHLEGYWRFDPIDDARTKVSLDLDFEFASRMLSFAVGPVFHQVANNLVDAFSKRARTVYGER